MFSGVPNGPLRLSPPQVHAAVHNSGDTERTRQDRRTTVEQAQPLSVVAEAGSLIHDLDLLQRLSEDALEVVHRAVSLPELLLERRPRHKFSAFRIDAVKALCEPW